MADPLQLVTLRALFTQEIVSLPPPVGPDRRQGAAAHARALLNAVIEELDEIDEEHRLRLVRLQDSTARVADLAYELTSFTYAAGSPHRRWRRWAALAALGAQLTGDAPSALYYAILAGEWAYVERCATRPPATRQLTDLAIGYILGSVAAEQLPNHAADPIAQAWVELAMAVPALDQATIASTLGCLADDWVDVLASDWQVYHYRSFPVFDPALCAAARLACRRGFDPQWLTPRQRAVLDSGLATGDPPALYPSRWRPERVGER